MPSDTTSSADRAGKAGGPPPRAAVALIRTRAPDPEYLFLRRAENPLDPWSGHFALPGGRQEEGDQDLLATCIRETWEECGLRLEASQLVSELPRAVAGRPSGTPMEVAPYLFEVAERPGLSLAQLEIAGFNWLTLSYLLDPMNHALAPLSRHYPERQFPCIRVGADPGEGAIWGFTYGVLKSFLRDFPAFPHPR